MTQSGKNTIPMVRPRKKWGDKAVDSKVVMDLRASAKIGNIGIYFRLLKKACL